MTSKLNNHALSILGILFASLLFIASTTSKKAVTAVPEATRIPAKFDFSPPSRAVSATTGIIIAMVKPTYVDKNTNYLVAPFNEMAVRMATDFDELITAKGFTMRGPFGSRDEMTYNDKVNSSFIMEIGIELNPQFNRQHQRIAHEPTFAERLANKNAQTTYTSKMYGQVTLGGNLVIKAKSAQYNELLWTKSIALETSSFNCPGQKEYPGPTTIATELSYDASVYNTISRELEKIYTKALNLAWQQIDPEEMKTVAEQGKKADKRGN